MQRIRDYVDRVIDGMLAWVIGLAGRRWNDAVLLRYSGPVGEFKETRYRKMPDGLSDELTRLVAEVEGWTVATVHVYHRLVRRMDLRRNRVELTSHDLATLTGLAARTARKHVKLLEDAGLVAVERRKKGANQHLPNLYRLCGDYAGVILYRADDAPIAGGSSIAEGGAPISRSAGGVWNLDSTKYLHAAKKQHANGHASMQHAADPDFSPGESDLSGTPSPPDPLSHKGRGGDSGNDGKDMGPVPEIPGMIPVMVQRLCQTYGAERVRKCEVEVLRRKKSGKPVSNPAGFVTDALRYGWDAEWTPSQPPPKTPEPGFGLEEHDPDWALKKYVSGKYADFINH